MSGEHGADIAEAEARRISQHETAAERARRLAHMDSFKARHATQEQTALQAAIEKQERLEAGVDVCACVCGARWGEGGSGVVGCLMPSVVLQLPEITASQTRRKQRQQAYKDQVAAANQSVDEVRRRKVSIEEKQNHEALRKELERQLGV